MHDSPVPESAADVLHRVGAVLQGHFVYTSGRHGPVYVNKDALYPHTQETSAVCRLLADGCTNDSVEVVAGPALGGIILSQWTAHHLGVPGVYAEKADGGLELRRGYDRFVAGRRVAVVEDILTTGGSLAAALDAVRDAGGNPVVAGALVNRGGVTASDVGVPRLFSLVEIDVPSWDAADCPLCADGTPVDTHVGKGSNFLSSTPTAAGDTG